MQAIETRERNKMNQTGTRSRLGRRLAALLPALGVLVVAAAVVAYLMGSVTQAERKRPQREARLVEVSTISPADHAITIEAWGTVQAARSVALQSQVGGEVQAIGDNFEPGAQVKMGDLLIRIDPSDYQLAVRRARSEQTRVRAELALEEGRRAVAEQEFALLETAVTDEQRKLMLREPQLETVRAAVAAAEAAVAEAELNLKRTELRAPFDALVLARGADLGTRVTTGTAIATLAGTDAYWIELAVPASALRWITIPGATVRLYHEPVWGAGVHREGRVIRLRGDLDDKGRMARLLVEVSDPIGSRQNSEAPRLLLGGFVRGEIEGHALDGVFAVERAWLRDGDTLWVMDDAAQLSIRPVEVVYRGANHVYVRDGLKPGERIVTSDLAVPAEGMALRAAGEPAGIAPGRPPRGAAR